MVTSVTHDGMLPNVTLEPDAVTAVPDVTVEPVTLPVNGPTNPVAVTVPLTDVLLGRLTDEAVQLGPPVEILEASIAPVSSKAVLIPPFGIFI